jgi:hypothetical protein
VNEIVNPISQLVQLSSKIFSQQWFEEKAQRLAVTPVRFGVEKLVVEGMVDVIVGVGPQSQEDAIPDIPQSTLEVGTLENCDCIRDCLLAVSSQRNS